jgi:hypothetical protein
MIATIGLVIIFVIALGRLTSEPPQVSKRSRSEGPRRAGPPSAPW